jgi:hypothetical protein
MVEDQEQNNQHDLVKQLTPSCTSVTVQDRKEEEHTLHQESQNDIPSSMELIVRLGIRHDFGFHSGSGGHWVFSSYSDTVEELRESITDDPSVQGCSPGGSQHN